MTSDQQADQISEILNTVINIKLQNELIIAEFHAIKTENADLKSQNDALIAEVTSLKEHIRAFINYTEPAPCSDGRQSLIKVPTETGKLSIHSDVVAATLPSRPKRNRNNKNIVEAGATDSIVNDQAHLPNVHSTGDRPMEGQNGNSGSQQDWQTVKHRKQTKGIIGSRMQTGDSSLKGVAKRAFLHISKLNPETTDVDLKVHLSVIGIEDAQVEKLNSKFPTFYSSFKVNIPFDKLTIANDGNVWPQGTRVQRFKFFRGGNAQHRAA